MTIWPHVVAYLADATPGIPGRDLPPLTPRALGYLEAMGLPCVCGGVETSATLMCAMAIITDPQHAHAIAAGRIDAAVRQVARCAVREDEIETVAAALGEWLSDQLWAPGRMLAEGQSLRDSSMYSTPLSLRLAALGARLGFGEPSRRSRRSAWDAECREILMIAVARGEIDDGSEYETADDVASVASAEVPRDVDEGEHAQRD